MLLLETGKSFKRKTEDCFWGKRSKALGTGDPGLTSPYYWEKMERFMLVSHSVLTLLASTAIGLVSEEWGDVRASALAVSSSECSREKLQ